MRTQHNSGFHPETFLAKAGLGRTIVEVPQKEVIFAQGDPVMLFSTSRRVR
jgi:hypothetical protein